MVEDFYIRRECGKTAINGMNGYVPFLRREIKSTQCFKN